MRAGEPPCTSAQIEDSGRSDYNDSPGQPPDIPPVVAGKTGSFRRNGIQRFTPTTGKSRNLILESARYCDLGSSLRSTMDDCRIESHVAPATVASGPARSAATSPRFRFTVNACFHFIAPLPRSRRRVVAARLGHDSRGERGARSVISQLLRQEDSRDESHPPSRRSALPPCCWPPAWAPPAPPGPIFRRDCFRTTTSGRRACRRSSMSARARRPRSSATPGSLILRSLPHEYLYKHHRVYYRANPDGGFTKAHIHWHSHWTNGTEHDRTAMAIVGQRDRTTFAASTGTSFDATRRRNPTTLSVGRRPPDGSATYPPASHPCYVSIDPAISTTFAAAVASAPASILPNGRKQERKSP